MLAEQCETMALEAIANRDQKRLKQIFTEYGYIPSHFVITIAEATENSQLISCVIVHARTHNILVMDLAVRYCSVSTVRRLCSEGWPMSSKVLDIAIEVCHEAKALCLLHNGCEISREAFDDALCNGLVGLAGQMINYGCTFTARSFVLAIPRRKVDYVFLMKMLQAGCPISDNTLEEALVFDCDEFACELIARGCNVTRDDFMFAKEKPDVLKCMRYHGYELLA